MEGLFPSESKVLSWLRTINSPELDFEAAVTYPEQQRLGQFRQKEPDLHKAARSWPLWASAYWHTLRDEILKLFDPATKRHNFAQWVLEYARATYPEKYRLPVGPSSALKNLAQDLSVGLVTPLHMAAALGIPRLVHHLLGSQSTSQNDGILGPPIFCALLGPHVLMTGTRPSHWVDVFKTHIDSDRVEAIRLLLAQEETRCDFRYPIRIEREWDFPLEEDIEDPHEDASLFALAFWVSASCNDPRILDTMACKGANFDFNTFFVLCHAETCMPGACAWPESFRKALQRLSLWALRALYGTVSPLGCLQEAYAQRLFVEIMYKYDAKLPREALETSIQDDLPFTWVLGSSVRGGYLLEVERLKMDEKFDPRLVVPDGSDHFETLCHAAVSGNQESFAEFLVKAGVDFSVVDHKGRTPIMVVEKPEMLDLLHLKHGIPISDADNEGHNLWHYACCSHDLALLEWLCQHDKDKGEHMQAVSHSGKTPLDVAIASIDEATSFSCIREAAVPLRLVLEMAKCGLRAPDNVNVHEAVSWGSCELVKALAGIGTDFRKVNDKGNSVLHHLNALATPELVRELMEILGAIDAKINESSQTPAESVIENLCSAHGLSIKQSASSSLIYQPSRAKMSTETFAEMLKGEHPAADGPIQRPLWERVCNVITKGYVDTGGSSPEIQSALDASLQAAFVALTELGFQEQYEDAADCPAIMPLEAQDLGRGAWPFISKLWFSTALKSCGKARRRKFDSSNSSRSLIKRAFSEEQWDTVAFLLHTGMSLGNVRSSSGDTSLVQQILLSDQPRSLRELRRMLKTPVREYFFVNKNLIWLSLMTNSKYPGFQLQKLRLLMQAGLSPNPSSSEDKPIFPLMLAMDPIPQPCAVRILLDHGADPRLGPGSTNAFLTAARLLPSRQSQELTLMRSLIDVLEGRKKPRFDWSCTYTDPLHNISFNALQAAAAAGNDRMLLLLLLHRQLKKLINDTSPLNPSTPVHLAATRGWIDCVEVLAAQGADLSRLDGGGLTPREVAERRGYTPICLLIDRWIRRRAAEAERGSARAKSHSLERGK